jgi:hypothetical protein
MVEAQPSSEGPRTLVVGTVQPWVGPLIEQGLVEPLDLAIGLGPIRAGPLKADAEPAAVSVNRTESVEALALSVSTRSIRTPWSAKQPAASTRNRAEVSPVSSGRSWLQATRERSSMAEWTWS